MQQLVHPATTEQCHATTDSMPACGLLPSYSLNVVRLTEGSQTLAICMSTQDRNPTINPSLSLNPEMKCMQNNCLPLYSVSSSAAPNLGPGQP